MPKDALLLAGPCVVDELDNGSTQLGGAGAIAACAAAPFAPTQLWARGGTDLPPSLLQTLDARRIDHSGLIGDGPADRYQLTARQFQGQGPALPEEEPHDPEALGACAVIGCTHAETLRALHIFQALPGRHLIIAAPDWQPGDDPGPIAAACEVLILPLRSAGPSDPLTYSETLHQQGCAAVLLRAGALGGFWRYKNKCGNWPVAPQDAKDLHGISASFAGALAGALCEHGKLDLRGLKRACCHASAIAGLSGRHYGPRALLGCDRATYQELFSKLRRHAKL